jgi:hypothetical protein
MTLSKTLVKTSLDAATKDVKTPGDVALSLDGYSRKFPKMFGITEEQEAILIENFLKQSKDLWTIEELQKIVVWLRDHWEDIPE